MNEYTASNGMVVRRDHNEDVNVIDRESGGLSVFMADGIALALREFFQHERDEELGRWRWPDNPNIVAWASRRSNEKDVTVLDEADGYVGYYKRPEVEDVLSTEGLIRRAARAYFESHPERKPWHGALPEEVWLMGSGLHEFIALVSDDGKFRFADGSEMAVTGEFITGRRIYPEGNENA